LVIALGKLTHFLQSRVPAKGGTIRYVFTEGTTMKTEQALREFYASRAEANLSATTISGYEDSPQENGYIESYNVKLRDELPARQIFTTLEETKVLREQ
jgi:hypothetical protein